MTDAEWERALKSACYQFEIYARQGLLRTATERRAALSDALQHAVGLLGLDRSRLISALQYARPIVERYCHTQGDNAEFFAETLAPIDDALGERLRKAP